MPHCGVEEAAVALAEIDEDAAATVHVAAQVVLAAAEDDLEDCEEGHA